MKRKYVYTHTRSANIQFKKNSKQVQIDTKYLKFVFYLKKISVSIATIEQGAGMTDDRRVTKVVGALNEK